MGKAGNKKRDRRIAETTEQYQDAVATRTEQQVLRSRDDAQLFTVDRTGSKNTGQRNWSGPRVAKYAAKR